MAKTYEKYRSTVLWPYIGCRSVQCHYSKCYPNDSIFMYTLNKVSKPTKQKKISKVKEWAIARAELIKEFGDRGITTCEIGLEGCTKNNFLGFAHTTKRRDAVDLKRVVLACVLCHSKVEYECEKWTGKNMEDYLEEIIANRTK